MVAIMTHHAESPGVEWFYAHSLEVKNFYTFMVLLDAKKKKMRGIIVKLTGVLIEDTKLKNFPV